MTRSLPTPREFRERLMFPIAGGARAFESILVPFQRRDFAVLDAQFQAVADPQINILIEGGVLEAGVHGVKNVYFASESRAIRNSLVQLTGQGSGLSRRAWLGWWENHQDEWSASRKVDEPSREPR